MKNTLRHLMPPLLAVSFAVPAAAQARSSAPPASSAAQLVEFHLQWADQLTALEEAHPLVKLALGGPDHWARACDAPCDLAVAVGDRLRLVGVDGPGDRVIEIPARARRIDVIARVGSPKKVAAGQVLTAVGLAVEALAAVPIGIGVANPWPGPVPSAVPLAVGLLLAAVGAVDLAVAIPTWVSNVDRTEVSTSSQPDAALTLR